VPFTSDYVARLASMVKRNMNRPYRFVCLCDKPFLIARNRNIERILIPKPEKGLFGWWSKLHLFRSDIFEPGQRILYLDLDTLVMQDLAPILDYPSPFALVPHCGQFRTRGGLKVLDRFNSSVMVWDAGVNYRLWDEWRPEIAKLLWGDQDWISEQMPEADTMPIEWFPRVSGLLEQPPGPEVKVVLCKKPKNSEAVKLYPWVAEAWH
jgi:hypothetical protein